MAAWTAVITNAGKGLMASWITGTTINFDSAASGTGTVPHSAMLAQTSLVKEKQTLSLIRGDKVPDGIKLKLQILAPETGYALNQVGIWASVDGGGKCMLALFQTDSGIPIPSRSETPDFVYNFFATIAVSNEGDFSLTVDSSALISQSTLDAAIASMLEANENAVARAYEAADSVLESLAGKADLEALDEHASDGGKHFAASGVCSEASTPSALVLEQEDFDLADGATIKFRVDITIAPSPDVTIEIAPWVPKALRTARGRALRGVKPGSWVTAVYSEPLGFFVLQGDGSDASSQRTFFHRMMTNTLNVRGW